jgi:ABC-type Zn uptake system ZnuABC Zn-binding protein ZnuA
MISTRTFLKTLLLTLVGAIALGAPAAEAARLKVGITLHPYYSFVANIVGDRADVIPLIDAEANPHGYAPQPADMKRMMSMDVTASGTTPGPSRFSMRPACARS